MPEPLTTLPGDIPGLLRRGSPVQTMFDGEIVAGLWAPLPARTAFDGYLLAPHILTHRTIDYAVDVGEVVLDLTDATGRAQAAAWADKATTYDTVEFMQRLETGMLPSLDERRAMDLGMQFADMTPAQIDTLARLCLRLAGRAS